MNTPRLVLRLSMLTLIVTGCEAADPTAPGIAGTPEIRSAKATAAGYTPIEIGLLPGDVEGYAPVINNSGHAAVSSSYVSMNEPRRGRWFIRAGGQNFIFEGGPIYDLSNGLTSYVASPVSAADGNFLPAIWTFNPSTGFAGPAYLDFSPGSGGYVQLVNEAGQAAGITSEGGSFWATDGTRTSIPNPDPSVFESTVMRDLNNRGDIAIFMADNNLNHHRGYLRTAEGAMILLPPLAGHVSSIARGVSELINGVVYVAGTSDDRQGNYRAVRWTVDVSTHAIIATQVRSERSYSTDMADDGTIAGDLAASAGTTPFVWRTNNTTVTLKAPKGLNSPSAWSISDNGRYVSGQAKSGGYGKPVYWAATQ